MTSPTEAAPQRALDTRAQHAVGAETFDHRDEPAARSRSLAHRITGCPAGRVVHGEHFQQLVERADPAGQRDEEVGGFRPSIACARERLHDPERAEVGRGALRTNEMARHDAQHFAARGGGGTSAIAHQPRPLPPYTRRNPRARTPRRTPREAACRRRQIFDRRAEQAHRVFCHVRP